jgi:hypothetical protein
MMRVQDESTFEGGQGIGMAALPMPGRSEKKPSLRRVGERHRAVLRLLFRGTGFASGQEADDLAQPVVDVMVSHMTL